MRRTSKASSRSGAGPPCSFFGILPRSWALWNGIGCSLALYLLDCTHHRVNNEPLDIEDER